MRGGVDETRLDLVSGPRESDLVGTGTRGGGSAWTIVNIHLIS